MGSDTMRGTPLLTASSCQLQPKRLPPAAVATSVFERCAGTMQWEWIHKRGVTLNRVASC